MIPVGNARYLPDYLSRSEQLTLVRTLAEILIEAPFFTPVMPGSGKELSVKMSNCGPLGWLSDRSGYRYQANHPVTGQPWPSIPDQLVSLWRTLCPDSPEPEACLINCYSSTSKLGLHQDKDEETFDAPVLSVSLGATALFRIGKTTRGGTTEGIKLSSGDIIILEGPSRLAYHGISRIYPGTSTLFQTLPEVFPSDCRINLTMRRVTI